VSGAKLGAPGVCDQMAVVDEVRWSLTSQGLIDESGQLVVDPLLHCRLPLLWSWLPWGISVFGPINHW